MKIKPLVILVVLSGCCTESNQKDCTEEEIAQREQYRKPHLISEQDGVRLYWVKPCWSCDPVYFTTPCGDTSWKTQVDDDETTTKHHQINGTGCK